MKRFLHLLTASILICMIVFNLYGCIMVGAVDLMDGVAPGAVDAIDDMEEGNIAVSDFAVRLLQSIDDDGNVFISPLSIMLALAMTANGASGQTLSQMESVLGMTADQLNSYLYSYVTSLPEGDRYKIKVANSIWFRNDDAFVVNNSFLQKNADYYGAEIYKTPFDFTTLNDVNSWVNRETNGMIPYLLTSIPDEVLMYLINTVAFEAEWHEIYSGRQIKDGIFTKEDGTEQNAKLMYCDEYRYLEDDYATGFIKSYYGNKYAFVAMLPDEGVTVSEYVTSLNGEGLYNMLSEPVYCTVKTAMPKFDVKYEIELSGVLAEMGMPDAFSMYGADFSNLGSYGKENIYIGSVIHKTSIELDERGTKAVAITYNDLNGAAAPDAEPKVVYLDRPFVYMIIDIENSLPIFIGTVTDVN